MEDQVNSAIERARGALLQRQTSDGCWIGKIYFSAWEQALHYFLFHKYLEVVENDKQQLVVRWLLAHQNPDGSWGLVDEVGSPGSIYVTCAAVLVLKVAGVSESSEAITKAKKWIDEQRPKLSYLQPIEVCDPLTQVFYALYGEYDWNRMRYLPLELQLLPSFMRPKMSPWIENTYRGLSVVVTLRKRRKLGLVQRLALRKARNWILKNQLTCGAWFGTVGRTICNVLALRELGYSLDSPPVTHALEFIKSHQDYKEKYYFRQHRFDIRVWDTAISMIALRRAGTLSSDRRLLTAGKWLLSAQHSRGGWAFIPRSHWLDTDDTALAIMALHDIDFQQKELDNRKDKAIKRAKNYLLKMQNDDGGWPTYTRNQSRTVLGGQPFVTEDPSVVDITAHILSALSQLGYKRQSKPIERGLSWLKLQQRKEGPWWGRWGLCYIYATWSVLQALADTKADLEEEYVRRAVDWLKSHQNPDGGCGESYLAYHDPQHAGRGESTAEQTSWAILGLSAVRYGIDSEPIEKGIQYLLKTQTKDGSWIPSFTSAALEPAKYEIYGHVFPLWALGTYYNNLFKR